MDFFSGDVRQPILQIVERQRFVSYRKNFCDFIIESRCFGDSAEVLKIEIAGIVCLEDFFQDFSGEDMQTCEELLVFTANN